VTTIEQRPLGATGATISALGFGCGTAGGLMNKGEPREQIAIVERAIAAGITYFDTAPNYGEGQSEISLGRVIRELGVRDRVQIGTKVSLLEADRADPESVLRGIFGGSLERLGLDHVDMLFLHSRVRHVPDDNSISLAGAEAAAAVFDRVNAEGSARYPGVTAHGDTSAAAALLHSGVFQSVQAYFSSANPSSGYPGASAGQQDFDGLIDQAASRGLGVINIQPLSAGGLIDQAHPYARDFMHGRLLDHGARIAALAQEFGMDSVYELALRFALSKPGISCVLVGFSSMQQLEEGLTWYGRGPLAPAQVEAVVDLSRRGD
jgi:L-galactose dehydrogenase/L-glyceraldehyde 3-phosphate reductase